MYKPLCLLLLVLLAACKKDDELTTATALQNGLRWNATAQAAIGTFNAMDISLHKNVTDATGQLTQQLAFDGLKPAIGITYLPLNQLLYATAYSDVGCESYWVRDSINSWVAIDSINFSTHLVTGRFNLRLTMDSFLLLHKCNPLDPDTLTFTQGKFTTTFNFLD